MDSLRQAYEQEAVLGFAKIFLTGDDNKVAKFAAFARTEGGLVVDGGALYKMLATPIETTIDPVRRTFDTSQVVRLYQELAEFAYKFGVKEMPEPKVQANDYNGGAPDFQAVVNIVRASIRRTSDDDLNILFMQRQILDEALKTKVITNTLPVIITGLSESELSNIREKLFPGQPSLMVSVDAVDEEDDDSMQTLVTLIGNRIRDAFAKSTINS